MPVALACLTQVVAFTLNECVILGLMKDVPQELTIAFNVGKGVATFFFFVSLSFISYYGKDSVKYWLFSALLPGPTYLLSDWFIFTIKSHQQSLNIFKVMETKESAHTTDHDNKT